MGLAYKYSRSRSGSIQGLGLIARAIAKVF